MPSIEASLMFVVYGYGVTGCPGASPTAGTEGGRITPEITRTSRCGQAAGQLLELVNFDSARIEQRLDIDLWTKINRLQAGMQKRR